MMKNPPKLFFFLILMLFYFYILRISIMFSAKTSGLSKKSRFTHIKNKNAKRMWFHNQRLFKSKKWKMWQISLHKKRRLVFFCEQMIFITGIETSDILFGRWHEKSSDTYMKTTNSLDNLLVTLSDHYWIKTFSTDLSN